MSWTLVPAVVTALVGLCGLTFTWWNRREAALRREDVLGWANEVIEALQSLYLVTLLPQGAIPDGDTKSLLCKSVVRTSVLVETGRLFFKNQVIDGHGADKHGAYRGYRPKILDPIVIAHQVALKWEGADDETRCRLRLVAEDCIKGFVTLAQKEVGRGITVSADTASGGDGANVEYLLQVLDGARLERARQVDDLFNGNTRSSIRRRRTKRSQDSREVA